MLKKTITYVDYNGTERTEDFYFNLSKAELIDLQIGQTGGLESTIDKIVKTKDQSKIIKLFKELILKAYGEKSDDGRRFIKSEELSTAFSQTEAFSELFMTFAQDDKAAAEFVNGILPSDVKANMNTPAIENRA